MLDHLTCRDRCFLDSQGILRQLSELLTAGLAHPPHLIGDGPEVPGFWSADLGSNPASTLYSLCSLH